MFEPNLRDERYLPFEDAGVISEWSIELPKEFRQFDYDTTSDVVLHIRYTAREGGSLLKQQAISELQTAIPANWPFLGVGLPGLEPGTSSLSEKHDSLQEVSRTCKTPANNNILVSTLFPTFHDIYSGCCTVAAPIGPLVLARIEESK